MYGQNFFHRIVVHHLLNNVFKIGLVLVRPQCRHFYSKNMFFTNNFSQLCSYTRQRKKVEPKNVAGQISNINSYCVFFLENRLEQFYIQFEKDALCANLIFHVMLRRLLRADGQHSQTRGLNYLPVYLHMGCVKFRFFWKISNDGVTISGCKTTLKRRSNSFSLLSQFFQIYAKLTETAVDMTNTMFP